MKWESWTAILYKAICTISAGTTTVGFSYSCMHRDVVSIDWISFFIYINPFELVIGSRMNYVLLKHMHIELDIERVAKIHLFASMWHFHHLQMLEPIWRNDMHNNCTINTTNYLNFDAFNHIVQIDCCIQISVESSNRIVVFPKILIERMI